MQHSCSLLGMRTEFLGLKGFPWPERFSFIQEDFPFIQEVFLAQKCFLSLKCFIALGGFPFSKSIFPLSRRASFPFLQEFSLPPKGFLPLKPLLAPEGFPGCSQQCQPCGMSHPEAHGAWSLAWECNCWWIHGIREGPRSYLAEGKGSTTKGIQDPWKSHRPEPGSWLTAFPGPVG